MQTLKLFILLFLFSSTLYGINYNNKPEVKRFIKKMHSKFHYKPSYLTQLFKYVKKNPLVPQKKRKKKLKQKSQKKRGSWEVYASMHLEHNQSELGAKFMHEHHQTLQKAYEQYGVPPEYVTAIIGIESYFGKNRGRYYVFDRLTHLSFDAKGKRKRFYQYQLQEFLRMCYREAVEPRAIKGSSSGAIGLAQFMPSNYKKLAVDFNQDGKIRLSSPSDAIGSIAHYFKKSGWRKDEPVGIRVSYKGNRFYALKTGYEHKYHRKNLADIYPTKTFNYNKKVMLIKLEKAKYDELWYGTKNFYVITRYNHSSYYAMAVHQLAEKIKTTYLTQYAPHKEPQEKVYLADCEFKYRKNILLNKSLNGLNIQNIE